MTTQEWIERIELIRATEAPLICETCGSTTPEVIDRKWCSLCSRWLPVGLFNRNPTKRDGRDQRCRECASKYFKEWRIRVTRQGGVGANGRVVKLTGTPKRRAS
jgi:DNA-directed RNA polymerase subunit RPC12/RpoP